MSEILLTFVHISDTHISQHPSYNTDFGEVTTLVGVKALVKQLNKLPFEPDFVLHTGDVAYNPDPTAYITCKEILGKIKYPIYYVAGNHDDHISLHENLQQSWINPQGKMYFDFELNGVQVIIANTNDPVNYPAGQVTEDQLEWLSQLCSADDNRPLIIAEHHNLLPVGIPWLDTYMRAANGEDFHKAILPARDRLRGVFFGHVHQNLDIERDGIHYYSTVSSWFQLEGYPGLVESKPDASAEPGYSIVTITKNQTFVRRCRFPLPAS
jgi:3',5'-cyclic-AMP phosphodiesterase